MTWYVYILRCRDQSLYTGITTDVTRRLTEHQSGNNGAKYTRTRTPLTLVYEEACASRSAAQIREASIKKLTRTQKIELITVKKS